MGSRYNNGSVPMYDAPYGNTYHSIGGVDIKATFAGFTFGNLQAISYSVTREKAPLYTMGSPEPRGYSRGKRGVAGSMVFIMFDSHALLEVFRALAGTSNNKGQDYKFVSDRDEPRPILETLQYDHFTQGELNANTLANTVDTQGVTSNFEAGLDSKGTLQSGWKREVPWYSDQIPPFNVTLTGVNEQGYAAHMAVLGVEILNEGYGVSIDDIVSEQQITYVARGISPWTRVTGAQEIQKGMSRWRTPASRATAGAGNTVVANKP